MNLVVRCDRAKSKVQVRILRGVDLQGFLVETRTIKVVTLEVGDGSKDCGRITADDFGAAVRDTAVGSWSGSPRCTSTSIGAEFSRGAALVSHVRATASLISQETERNIPGPRRHSMH